MLTDSNIDVIEWVAGRIQVHNPHRLAEEVSHKYFRHSKYASFQRQLNYFRFRKIEGKEKVSPCAYVNDDATDDLRSLLFIKRKTNGSTSRKTTNKAADPKKDNDVSSKPTDTPTLNIKPEKISSSPNCGSKRPLSNVNNNLYDESTKRRTVLESLTPNGPVLSSITVSYTSQQTLPSGSKPLSECLHFPSENTLAVLTKVQKNPNNIYTSFPINMNMNTISTGLETRSINTNSIMPCPATTAMNAAVSSNNTNCYESAPYLGSLISEHNGMPPPSSSNEKGKESGNAKREK